MFVASRIHCPHCGLEGTRIFYHVGTWGIICIGCRGKYCVQWYESQPGVYVQAVWPSMEEVLREIADKAMAVIEAAATPPPEEPKEPKKEEPKKETPKKKVPALVTYDTGAGPYRSAMIQAPAPEQSEKTPVIHKVIVGLSAVTFLIAAADAIFQ